jgi:Superinfection immunity protein
MITLLLIGLICNFFPTYVAIARRHNNCGSIFVLNLFLGWTLIGWVVALVWSFSSQSSHVVPKETVPDPSPKWDRTAIYKTEKPRPVIATKLGNFSSSFSEKD